MFATIAQTDLRAWLQDQIDQKQALLVQQTEMVGVFRAQGQITALSDLLKQMDAAKRMLATNT
ncbi:MAG: hypothetical protein AB7S63_14535 [Thauera sp.]